MLSVLFTEFDLSRWETWIVPVAGLLVAGLGLILGWTVFGSRPSADARAFTEGILTEQRKAPRREVSGILVVLTPPQGEPVNGWVMNHSSGGLCVSVPQRVAVGATFQVRLVSSTPGVPTVPVRVKRCLPDQGRWALGCRFIQVPPAAVLKKLG